MEKCNLSIIIPAYNEQSAISWAINDIYLFYFQNKQYINKCQLIIVNDGSTDFTNVVCYRTYKHIHQALVKHNIELTITHIHCKPNHGKGYAIREGLKDAKFETIMILDADLSVKPHINQFILDKINQNNPFIIVGQRNQTIKQPNHRLFLGWVFRNIVQSLFKFNLKDTQCPYKIIHKIPNLHNNLTINGFAYDIELLLYCRKLNFDIIPYQVEYKNRKNSKVTIRKICRMAYDIIYIGLRRF